MRNVETINNWRGDAIEVVRSKGGTLVVANPLNNLVKTGVPVWPPPEIVQKLYKSRQVRAFEGTDQDSVTSVLGYYSDLQSLHSEDAITWSVFETLLNCEQSIKNAFASSRIWLIGFVKRTG